LGKFYTTSNFDREYLRNDSRYPKSARYVIENDSAGETSPANFQKVGHVRLYPPKPTFFERLYFGPYSGF